MYAAAKTFVAKSSLPCLTDAPPDVYVGVFGGLVAVWRASAPAVGGKLARRDAYPTMLLLRNHFFGTRTVSLKPCKVCNEKVGLDDPSPMAS